MMFLGQMSSDLNYRERAIIVATIVALWPKDACGDLSRTSSL